MSAAFGGSGETLIKPGYPALINHDPIVDRIAEVAEAVLGENSIVRRTKPSLGVEDFSYFLMKRPGAFFHLGAVTPKKASMPPCIASDSISMKNACLWASQCTLPSCST